MELGAAGVYRERGGLVVAAITRVFTLEAAAHILGEDIDLIDDIPIDMEPEDGRLTIWGVGEDHAVGFTDFGLDSLQDFIRERRANEKRAEERLVRPVTGRLPFSGRIRVSVPRMGIGESAATNLALVLHELATNSVKHGALSTQKGLLDVACLIEADEAVIVWTERGGPPVTPPMTENGFGSKLLERVVIRHLRGSVSYTWPVDGMIATLRVKTSALVR